MKKISQLMFATFVMALLFCLPQMSAQSDATISHKITDKEGNVIVKKKRFAEGENVEDYIESLNLENGINVEVTVQENGTTKTIITTNDEKVGISDIEQKFLMGLSGDLDKEMAKVQEKLQGKKHKKHHYNYNYNYSYDYNDAHHKPGKKRALLGIYPNYTDRGVMISSLVSGGGAEAAGLERGDRVAKINGIAIQTGSDLRSVLSDFEPGDLVIVEYVRDGQTFTTQSNLGAKRSYDRDPCKIFIGVQLSGAERGVYINGVIEGTAADKSDVQTGDVIIEMDGVEVNSFDELLVERNKHQPGDDFVLTVLRNDQVRIVEAQFLSCDEETAEEEVIEEVIEPTTIEQPIELTETDLQLEELKTFPNPTYGKLTLRFKGEAVPTTIRITDVTGKVVYTENLSTFDGYYSRELQLDNAAPGNMIVTVQQADKVISEQVLLLPRA